MKKYSLLIAGLLLGFLIWPVFIDSQVLIRKEQIEDGYVVLIGAVQTAGNDSSVDFTTTSYTLDSTYDQYMVALTELIPANEGDSLNVRISQAGAFKTSGYHYVGNDSDTTAPTWESTNNANGAAFLTTLPLAGAATGEGISGVIYFSDPETTTFKKFWWELSFWGDEGTSLFHQMVGAGSYGVDTTAIDGVRFMFSTGNITSGTFALYGFGKS